MAHAWGFQIPLARCCALPRLDDPVSLLLILRKPRTRPSGNDPVSDELHRQPLPRWIPRKRDRPSPRSRYRKILHSRYGFFNLGFNNFYMRSRDTTAYEIDEALWEAYRRYDKSAVMNRLISRYLPALAFAARARSTFAQTNELTNPSGLSPSRATRSKR